ncbi:MAG TPA: S53 family peptidase [Pirellulales bacterium]|nr:S53 family peptidase [Pirellulales bacterium]
MVAKRTGVLRTQGTKADGYRELRFEELEQRQLLSATDIATPLYDVVADATKGPSGYSPAQMAQAYGFNQVAGGLNGAGTTIAIVDAYSDPNLVSDVAVFDKQFGLAPINLTVVNQTGGSKLPAANAGWAAEIALDVEWAHAMAPGAKILLVEATNNSMSNLLAAENYARNAAGVVVVSNSWGSSEFSSETSDDSYFTTPTGHQGVTFTVAAGDSGAPAEYPSSSPNVLSVGGTTLKLTASGAWSSETVWSDGGGGMSKYEAKPSYQSSLSIARRGTPDVSYDANPSTGVSVYNTYGGSGWAVYGGTSIAAPQWAAIIAIADEGRIQAHEGSLSNAQAVLYSLPSSDFHDIASGNDGNGAGKGYDLASGLGSPYAQFVIRDLIAYKGTVSASYVKPATMMLVLNGITLSSHGTEFGGDTSGDGARADDADNASSVSLTTPTTNVSSQTAAINVVSSGVSQPTQQAADRWLASATLIISPNAKHASLADATDDIAGRHDAWFAQLGATSALLR